MAFVRIVVQQLDPARMDEVTAYGETVRAARGNQLVSTHVYPVHAEVVPLVPA